MLSLAVVGTVVVVIGTVVVVGTVVVLVSPSKGDGASVSSGSSVVLLGSAVVESSRRRRTGPGVVVGSESVRRHECRTRINTGAMECVDGGDSRNDGVGICGHDRRL